MNPEPLNRRRVVVVDVFDSHVLVRDWSPAWMYASGCSYSRRNPRRTRVVAGAADDAVPKFEYGSKVGPLGLQR